MHMKEPTTKRHRMLVVNEKNDLQLPEAWNLSYWDTLANACGMRVFWKTPP